MDYETEYKRALQAYGKNEQEIVNLLGPVLGFPTGPFPEVCGICNGGPCTNVEACSKECLCAPYVAADLAAECAKRLTELQAKQP